MSLADQQWCPTSVQVTVLQARGLRAKGKSGTNDAYAVMAVGKEKYQTSVAEKSVAPMWKEEATFDLPQPQHGGGGGVGDTERSTLRVHVLHRALVGADKLLGKAVISLQQLSEDRTRSKTEWFKLLDKTGKADKDRGEVLVDIQFMRNNMTASMLDLSAAGKSRSRLGKLKDKVQGKKKESDAVSAVVPSFAQVLTDSEEEGDGNGEVAAHKDEKKKKHKLKLFSPKSNLQKSISQSMSVLPGKNSSLSGSQSSGLNVDSSEGKKKFRFMKRSGSSGSKDSSSEHQKHGAAEQSNLCINASHVNSEEPRPRTSNVDSSFSLASSGHGSMEDVPERIMEEMRRKEEEEEERVRRQEAERLAEEKRRQERRILEEEERIRRAEEERIQEEVRRQEEERRKIEEEKVKKEKEERIQEEVRRQEEERRKIEEEKVKKEKEERIRKEEERIQEEVRRQEEERRKIEEEKVKKEKEERIRREEEERIQEEVRRQEEERRKIEEEKVKKEKEERIRKEKERIQEEVRRQEEERRKIEEEKVKKEKEERVRREEERRREEEERRKIEEKVKKEKEEMIRSEDEEIIQEEMRRQEGERRKIEEEKFKKEKEERIRREEEERIQEERRRQEEERRKIKENKVKKEKEEKIRREEEERIQEERRRQEEERKLSEERRRLEEEERIRREEERVQEEMRKQEEEEMLRRQECEAKRRLEEQEKRGRDEVERKKKEEEEKRIEAIEKIREVERVRAEEKRRRNEEERRLIEEKRILEEKERIRIEEKEKIQREEEERIREEERKHREVRARKEEEEYETLVEEKKRQEEQERRIEEEERKKEQEMIVMEEQRKHEEEEERIRMEEEAEEEAKKLENRKLTRNVEEEKRTKNKKKVKVSGMKSKAERSAENTSTNPFDESFSNEDPNSPAGPHSRTSKEPTVQQRSPSAVSSLQGREAVSTDDEDLSGAQREKRPAPQPPGRDRAQRRSPGEQDGSTLHLAQSDNRSKGKDVKTVGGVSPQRTVHVIAPLSRSPTRAENTQSLMQSSQTVNTAKHGKRPAPSRPLSDGPETASSSDGSIPNDYYSSEVKREPVVRGLNPFEDDEDKNELTAEDYTSTGSIQWPPAVSKAADDNDAVSQAKIKSSKNARAPLLPAKTDATSSSSANQSTEGGHGRDGTGAAVTDNNVTRPCDPEEVQESRVQESQAAMVPSAEERKEGKKEGKKEGLPTASRRLQPVKPLNPLRQQPVSVIQGGMDNKSTGYFNQVWEQTKVNGTGLKGPYSQLTQKELISLVLKQENQLSQKDKRISELEQYIDNLLVCVMEEKPSILMSLNSLK